MHVTGRHFITDSGGAGRTRGGEAVYCEFGPTEGDMEVGYVSDGNDHAPEGTRGGGDGACANQFRRDLNGDLHQLDACAQAVIPEGHTIVSYSCGGGGYGAPLERDADKVAHDVREKWVSVDVAKQTYGVVVSAGGVIDQAATNKLRAGQGG
jgi:N-methylhydantoinase B